MPRRLTSVGGAKQRGDPAGPEFDWARLDVRPCSVVCSSLWSMPGTVSVHFLLT